MEPGSNGTPDTITTASIAAETLSSLESGQPTADTPPAAPESAPPTEESAAPAEGATNGAAPSPEAMSAAMQFLHNQGHKATKVDGRQNWLPVTTVEQMLLRFLDQHRGSFDKERERWESERSTLATDAEAARQFRRMLEGDPRALLQEIGRYDPRYLTFLQQQQIAAEEDDPEPPPDIDLGNGRRTYSLEGIKKLRAWDQRRIERTIEQRLQPFAAREQQAREQDARQRVDAVLAERSQAQISRAKSWPKWSEFEGAILKALQEDSAEAERTGAPLKYASLHDAYMDVAGPHLSASASAMREQILKELNSAPRSTAVGTTGAEPTRAAGNWTTADVARETLARLEGR